METAELGRTIEQNLKSAGLLDYVDRGKTQLLEFPGEFFVEIVLKDASKLEDANKVVEQVRSDLERQGISLDSIVRASWTVGDVTKQFNPAAAPDVARQGILSLPFKATLVSGPRKQDVWVEMTPTGYEQLERLDKTDESSLEKIVRDFLVVQLSVGGTSYWDPIRYPRGELNGAAVLYVLHHTPVVAT